VSDGEIGGGEGGDGGSVMGGIHGGSSGRSVRGGFARGGAVERGWCGCGRTGLIVLAAVALLVSVWCVRVRVRD